MPSAWDGDKFFSRSGNRLDVISRKLCGGTAIVLALEHEKGQLEIAGQKLRIQLLPLVKELLPT